MNKNHFLSRLSALKKPLLSDGAMGTLLNARGVNFEDCFDELNLTRPSLVAEIHRLYIEAGSQIIQTNTFGANRYKLSAHGLEEKVAEINRAGVELARRVVLASFKEVYVAGDIGPLGVRLAPFGRVQAEQARAAYREQIQALVQAGVDLLIIETMSDLYEVKEAILAAKEVSDLPAAASMTFTRDDRTLLGDSPSRAAEKLIEFGADIIGVNCSGGPVQILRILRQMKLAAPEALFTVMPNAGWPEQVGGRVMYPANPDYFGTYAPIFCKTGAVLIGGCCGTTPAHIAAMRKRLDSSDQDCQEIGSDSVAVVDNEENGTEPGGPTNLEHKLSSRKFVIAVEMDPPKGLSPHKIIAGASLLGEAGADVINVADSPMARMRMSPWAVCSVIQRDLGIETTLHFPTRGRNLLRVQGDLLAAHAMDIRNIFVVMGDPTAIGDYPDAMDNYDVVPSGLIRLIKKGFNMGLDHSGMNIGHPTSFFVGCAINLKAMDFNREVNVLRRKIDAGTDFALSQPVFDPTAAGAFIEAYQSQYGPLEIPVLVGILPPYGVRHAAFLHNEVPGIEISEEIHTRLRKAGEDAPREGIRIALDIIDQIKPWASGIYIMPAFNRFDIAAELIDGIVIDKEKEYKPPSEVVELVDQGRWLAESGEEISK
jgi:methionine synthase / methylenetetrahydrofolate reductase(NADPH)